MLKMNEDLFLKGGWGEWLNGGCVRRKDELTSGLTDRNFQKLENGGERLFVVYS